VWVPILGWWEVAIGVCLLKRSWLRVALLLLAVRLPGTALALALHADTRFIEFPYAPSPEGQYLIKDLLRFGAAMVIGGTVRGENEHHAEE
jgi:1-acyl-sn-glycerol-3-phosphate acyltransferase